MVSAVPSVLTLPETCAAPSLMLLVLGVADGKSSVPVMVIVSVVLLGLAVKTLPMGTAYAVWTGIGTVGTVILGIVLFAEPVTAMRIGQAVDFSM